MDVERGRTVKGWRPRRLGERALLWLGSGSCWLPLPSRLPLLLSVFSSPCSCSHSSLSPAQPLRLQHSLGLFLFFYSGLPIRSKSTDLEKPVWDQILTCAYLAGGFLPFSDSFSSS